MSLLRAILAPILTLFLFILGSGLFSTFQSVRLHNEEVSDTMIGAVTAAFAAGLVVGSRFAQTWILRVGHIRACAAFASGVAAVTLLQGLFVVAWLWIPLRLLSGIFTAGLYIVIESWLLEGSTPTTRGRALSVYMISFYVAQGLGQLLLNLADTGSLYLFCLPVVLFSLSIWPITLIKGPSPALPQSTYMSIWRLFKETPTSMVGCLFAGMILQSFYGLGPVFIQELGLKASQIGPAMALWILSGFTLQWPIGHLSDHFDRRSVLAIVSCLAGAACLAIGFIPSPSPALLLSLVAIFGGFSFTIYPLSISHAGDRMGRGDFVSLAASLLLVYGVGSIFGPLLAPFFMSWLGPSGLALFMGGLAFVLGGYSVWRRTSRSPVPSNEKVSFTPVVAADPEKQP